VIDDLWLVQLFAENQILYMSLPVCVVPERFCVVVYAPQLLMDSWLYAHERKQRESC
jgi:hypothetical protein